MTNPAFLSLALNPDSSEAAYRQLYGQVRSLILEGRIKAGTKLTSTRILAVDLALSRTTIIAAYEQLQCEGYVETRPGSGYFVCQVPDNILMINAGKNQSGTGAEPSPLSGIRHPRSFQSGYPDNTLFPFKEWSHYLARSWRQPAPDCFGVTDPMGHGRLREAIAAHLLEWRGIKADAGQIIITAGSAEGFELSVRTLTGKKSLIGLEDPGYAPFGHLLDQLDRRQYAIPVDECGANIALCPGMEESPGLLVVTPSRQYPLGMTMPLTRRLQFLEWSEQTGAYILEDDYDSEFRYQGRPIEALAALDRSERVIYASTFSKIFSAGLKLGYLCVPPGLVNIYRKGLQTHASIAVQPALAAFMLDGGFAKHIRRTRRLYQTRQTFLLSCIHDYVPALTIKHIEPSGMHLIAGLAKETARRMSDVEAERKAGQDGIMVKALSTFYRTIPSRQGLILGFTCFGEEETVRGAKKLQTSLS